MPPEDEEEMPVHDGPDPRSWPGNASVWNLVEDIETLDRVAALMKGTVPRDGMSPAHEEACRFLHASGTQLREELALLLLSMYAIRPPEEPDVSPFASAGKPRAFGAEPAPPAAPLPSCPRKVQEARPLSTTTVWESGLTCEAAECGQEFILGEEILYFYGRRMHQRCAAADAASRREASGEDGDVMAASRALLESGARVILTRRQLRDLIALAVLAGLEPVRKPDTGRCQWYSRMPGWSAGRVRAGLSAPEVAGMWSDFLDAGRMPPLRGRDLQALVEVIGPRDRSVIVTSPL